RLSVEQAVQLYWQAGLVACLGSGRIAAAGALVGERLRRWLPRAALLSTSAPATRSGWLDLSMRFEPAWV
ncbi:MAG: hypothetical protein ACKOPS_27775, partial [Cyanobium sp.]